VSRLKTVSSYDVMQSYPQFLSLICPVVTSCKGNNIKKGKWHKLITWWKSTYLIKSVISREVPTYQCLSSQKRMVSNWSLK
jgi:hypothetical protein